MIEGRSRGLSRIILILTFLTGIIAFFTSLPRSLGTGAGGGGRASRIAKRFLLAFEY